MVAEPSSEATSRLARVLVPIVLGVLFLGLWEFLVRWLEVPKFVLPAPSQIFDSLLSDYATLAERWNGSTWALQASPNPTGATFSVTSYNSDPLTSARIVPG